MYNTPIKLKNKKGSTLMLSLVVIVALLMYAAAFISIGINQSLLVDIFKRRTAAFNIAEAGLDHAIVWLRSQSSPPIGDRTNPWGSVESLGGGTYSVVIADLGMVGASTGIRRYKVTSTGIFGNARRILANYVQVDNYARYLWFTDREVFDGSNVWFNTNDTLNGPTHTNGHFNIAGDPVFQSEVRSVDDYLRYYNNGNNINSTQLTNAPYDEPTFEEGVGFGAETINMPSQALSLRSAAASGGIYLQGNSRVVLNSNGTMNVTNSKKKWNNKNMSIPANGALFVSGGNLTISGTLNGRLTVGASADVVIPNSIVYADNPRVNPASDDTMGIISESDIVVDDSAPSNMEIDACAMALNTSFMMENYWVGPAKGTLTVYGGIIQDERGPVGTFNGSTGQKVSGYSKNYSYDSRLLSSPPPFMPTTGDYITLSWEED
ncbi:MAG: DUF4900 domain-containing protein [Candidatus Omnitrophica bacterium]|nr:DUF4900 domain-containing protein [Candidatus Omnitrophota bacterium]